MIEVMIITWFAQLNGANVPWWFWALELALAWTEVWSAFRSKVKRRMEQEAIDRVIKDAIAKIKVEIDDGK